MKDFKKRKSTSYVAQINKINKKNNKILPLNELNVIGRYEKFSDYIFPIDPLADPGSHVDWTNGDTNYHLINKIQLGFTSNSRIGKKIIITKIEGKIAAKPVFSTSLLGAVDELRTLLVYDKCPSTDGGGDWEIKYQDVCKNFGVNQTPQELGSDAFSGYNVQNSDRFVILYDNYREMVINTTSSGFNTAWFFNTAVSFAKSLTGKQTTSLYQDFKLENLKLPVDFNDTDSRIIKTGALFILSKGNFETNTFYGTGMIRIYFEDEQETN